MALTIVAVPDPQWLRIRLNVTSPTSLAATTFTLERSSDGGSSWRVVRGDQGATHSFSGTAKTTFDIEGGYGTPVIYRAKLASETAWGASSAPVQLPDVGPQWSVHDIATPLERLWVCVEEWDEDVHDAPRGVFNTIGRADPIITYGKRHWPTGTVTFYADDTAHRDDLLAMLGIDHPIVIRGDYQSGWTSRAIAVGQLVTRRVLPHDRASAFIVAAEWSEIDASYIPLTRYGSTWADLVSHVPTWAMTSAQFATWNDLAFWTWP